MFFEILICTCLSFALFWFKYFPKKYSPNKQHAILITGCDSGIGYSIAKYCHEIGFTVFAACLNEESEGSILLKQLEDVYIVQLDVTSSESILYALTYVNNVLEKNPGMSKCFAS